MTIFEAAQHPLVAMVVAGVVGAVGYFLKDLPGRVWGYVKERFTFTVVVAGEDPAFQWVLDWLMTHPSARKAKNMKLVGTDLLKKGADWQPEPGFGTHLVWEEKRPVFITRNKPDAKEDSSSKWWELPKESFTITTFGRDQEVVRRLINRVMQTRKSQDPVGAWLWHTAGYWRKMPGVIRRPLESIILPHDQKHDIVRTVDWFFDNSKWYEDRGIPYRCGVLFQGPPGTGKTSLVRALASYRNVPVYILNLAMLSNDNDLMLAFQLAGANCIILLEDIDTVDVTAKREEAVVVEEDDDDDAKPAEATPAGKEKSAMQKITLSGLLNAIDGVAAPEGRLLVMTTNHPERLDAALTRSARVDRTFDIGLMEPAQVGELAAKFFPGETGRVEVAVRQARAVPLRAPAAWQNDFLEAAKAASWGRAA